MESAPLLPMNICEDSSWMGVVKAEVMRFRDSLGLRCRDGSVDLNELLMGTLEDIKNQYKKYSSFIPIFEGNHDSLHQVLARFEDFPYKKLETIRVAAALYVKLDGILATLKSWKMVHPISKQLDKIESYFCKIKEEVDATECTKDEESKRFQSNNIEFDFGVLLRIKEAIVDLSSNCIEMALKEGRELKEVLGDDKLKANHKLSKVLWRAFQLAFRVYNFAGGQDERADQLTSELAREIETYSHF